MSKYRATFVSEVASAETFLLSSGGSETEFIFLKGIELPHFALFTLLATDEGRDKLTEYSEQFIRKAAVGTN